MFDSKVFDQKAAAEKYNEACEQKMGYLFCPIIKGLCKMSECMAFCKSKIVPKIYCSEKEEYTAYPCNCGSPLITGYCECQMEQL